MKKKCEICNNEFSYSIRYKTKKYCTIECGEVKSLFRRSIDILSRKGLSHLKIDNLFDTIHKEWIKNHSGKQ
ncbi:MAG: hypothetical protein AABY22_03485 [Nanoarchaeota archaeon]